MGRVVHLCPRLQPIKFTLNVINTMVCPVIKNISLQHWDLHLCLGYSYSSLGLWLLFLSTRGVELVRERHHDFYCLYSCDVEL